GGSVERAALARPAGLGAAFWPFPGAAGPGAAGSSVGADVQVVAVADNPDGHRVPQAAIWPRCDEPKLVRVSDLVKLVTGPCGHRVSLRVRMGSGAGHRPVIRSRCSGVAGPVHLDPRG